MPGAPFPHTLLANLRGVFKSLTTSHRRDPKLTIGLDIGATSVKVVALGPRKGTAKRPIIGQNLLPVNSASNADPADSIRSAIDTLRLPVKNVNISVSGQWVIMRVVEMPPMKPAELKQALPFEAQRYLPFNISDVILDGVTLGPSSGNKSWVLIVACKKDLIERRIAWIKQAGFEPGLIDVDALALSNAYLDQDGDVEAGEGQQALVNVGSQLTNLVVFKGEIPYLVRDIPWGGEKLLRQSAEQLGVDVDTLSKELDQKKVKPEIQEALRTTCEALASELQLSFDYFENRFGQPPQGLLVSGGLSQSSPFIEALKSHVAQPVIPWTPTGGLSGQFAVAYGLALRME